MLGCFFERGKSQFFPWITPIIIRLSHQPLGNLSYYTFFTYIITPILVRPNRAQVLINHQTKKHIYTQSEYNISQIPWKRISWSWFKSKTSLLFISHHSSLARTSILIDTPHLPKKERKENKLTNLYCDWVGLGILISQSCSLWCYRCEFFVFDFIFFKNMW